MKKINRWLAALMCICVLCTSLPGDLLYALAEGQDSQAETASAEILEAVQAEPDPTEAPTAEPTAIPTAEPTEVPTTEPTAAPTAEQTEAPEQETVYELGGGSLGEPSDASAEPEAEPVVEEPADDEDQSVFEFGYAKVLEDAALYAQFNALTEVIALIQADGIVLVSERRTESGLDRVRVNFVFADAAVEAWMDASMVEPLAEEDVLAFQESVTEAICYQDDVAYPLPEPEILLHAEASEEPTAEPAVEVTPAPEVTADPSEMPAESEEPAAATEEPAATEVPAITAEPEQSTTAEPEATEVPATAEPAENIETSEATQAPADETAAEERPAVMMMTALFSVEDESDSVTLSLEQENAELKVGESFVIKPVFSDGGSYSVSYTLSESGIVEIDGATGTLTALSAGTAVVQVKCSDLVNASASFTATVVDGEFEVSAQDAAAEAAVFAVQPDALEMLVGDQQTIVCAIPEGMTGKVEYALSSDNVIELDENGVVSAIGEGTCVITATLVSETEASEVLTATSTVKVHAMPESLKASLAEDMDVGDTAQIAVELDAYLQSRLSYQSSDETIAKVSETGFVEAVGRGACTIEVTLGELSVSLPLTVYSLPESFELSVSSSVLNMGETAQLSVKLPAYTRGEVTYGVLQPNVAGVDSNGLVMVNHPGVCELTAAIGELTRSVEIVVYGAPTSIDLTLDAAALPVGYHTNAYVDLPEYIIADITIFSSDPDVADVDENGVVTAVSPGFCEIIAQTDSGLESRQLFEVADCVLDIKPKYSEIAVGQSFALKYTVSDEAYAEDAVVFSSSDESVAKVDENTGSVTAVGDGEAVITATLQESGETAKCYVTVHKAPTRIAITSATTTIGKGQTTNPIGYTLYADDEPTIASVSFSSSNSKVVKVNSKGQMQGVKAGTAKITVTAYNKTVKTSFKVTVRNAPKSLTIKPTSTTLAVGQAGKIQYSLTKNTAAGVTFTSSNSNVVAVDAKGILTAVGVGTAKVRVKTHNGLVKYSNITVKKAPENVTLKVSASKLGVDMTAKAAASVDTSSSAAFAYRYWTDKPDIVSVNESTGAIKALKPGVASIFVETYNGVTTHAAEEGRVETSVRVTVVPKPDNVTVVNKKINIMVGRTIKLPVSMTMDDGSTECLTTYKLTTSNKKIAAVNSSGQIKGVKAGTATITVTAATGQKTKVAVTVRAKATKAVLSKSSATLGVGMSTTLTTRVYYSSSKYFTYAAADSLGVGKYTSNKPEVATVDPATGKITAVSAGTATITFTTYNSKKASCKVTVKGVPTAIDMNVDALKLGVDMTSTLKAVFQPNEMGAVTFSSSDSSIATVNPTSGLVKAIAPGKATITISAGKGVTNTCEVTVVPKPDNVTVVNKKINIMVGRTIKLPVSMTMDDGSTECLTTYKLTTSNKKIAAVNSSGQIKGVKAGTATITVTAATGQKTKVAVTVRAKATKAVLSKSSATLGVGMSTTLTTRVYYSSSKYFTYAAADSLGVGKYTSNKPEVVTVDPATGKITAVSVGTATITFTTYNSKKASCKVTVRNAPTSISLSKSELAVGEKMTASLSVAFNDNEYGAISWSSDDTSIATVNSSGKVTGVKVGSAIITATAHNGATAQCAVTVKPGPDAIKLNMTSSNMAIGGKITLKATCTYNGTDDCMATLKYKSSNTKVATVSSSGVVKGVKAGSATIRVSAQNGTYKDCKIVVRKKPTKVAFGSTKLYLAVGQSANVSAKIYYSGGSCSYSVNDTSYAKLTFSDPTIAKLDPATGRIVALEVGGTYATLKTYNGKTAKCRIYVSPAPEWIAFDEPFLTMSAGETVSMSCSQSPGSITTMTYTSSDSSVVKVSGNGTSACKMSALKQGTAVITATSSNGQVSTCEVTVMAAPQKVEFASDSITIGIGETASLPSVTVSSVEGECSQAVAYSSSSAAVSLPSPGYVTGVKAGTAVITAKTGGKSDTCTVTVLPEATQIKVTPEASVIAVGDTTMLEVWMDHAGGYTFEVDDDSIISVTNGGEVTALKPGTAVITATSYNDLTASCTIRVLAAPDQVRLSADDMTLKQGASARLTASIPQDTLGSLRFVSSNEAVVSVKSHCDVTVNDQGGATVNAYADLTAEAPGTAVVQVYVEGHEGVFDTCEVEVLAKPTKISISADQLTMRKGTTAKLSAVLSSASGYDCYGEAVYKSSASAVASVSDAGVVTAKKAGEAVITVSADADSSVSAQCKVIVTDTGVGFDVSELKLSVGESYALRVDLPDGKDAFSIESSNANVAKVDAKTYVITAVSAGTATITARNDGEEAVCEVTVTEKPDSIALSATEKRLVIGKSFTLTAEPLPAGTAAKVYFTSSDETVAKVAEDGRVEAVGYGTAVIRAANHDGSVYAECTVKGVYEPEQIRFGELDDIVIAVGDSYTLELPRMYNANGDCDSTYTLAISNSNCARISVQNGRFIISALAEGEATLRLKTANGKTDTHKVVVAERPTAIYFDSTVIRMAAGETYSPKLLSSNGSEVSVALTVTEGANYVRIGDDGELVALAEGTAKISAQSKAFTGLTAAATVQVLKAPSSMTLSASSAKLGVGEKLKLTAEFNQGASAADVTYVSSDETVVHTGSDGSILAVGVGTARITATAFNGCSASCDVTVLSAPTQLSVSPEQITACVRDQVQLEAAFGSANEHGGVEYQSSNTNVASVSSSGLVTFRSLGDAVITVSTHNGLTAEVPVTVSATPSSVQINPAEAVILAGDSAQLNIVFDRGAGYFTIRSSDPKIVSVTAGGFIEALKPGTATVVLEMPGLNLSASCRITVVKELEGIELTAAKTTLELHDTVQLNCRLIPDNAIGGSAIRYTSSAPEVAQVDAKTGLVTGMSYGTAVITAEAPNGQSAQIELNVLGGKRRMLIAYYFGEPGDSGYLPFAYNNGYSMQQAFSMATAEGQKYDIVGPMSNAPKSTLFGAIDSHFADATEDDVSLIYLCAHGSASFGPTGEYNFKLDSTHRVMASELMNRLEKIKGRVVLIMDSCHSGGIIDCNKARLDAQGGRISILASSHRDTNSCYWSVSEKLTSIDFFTHALLQGVGFNESNGIGGARGWFREIGGPADDAGNADQQITVQELFNYAKKVTVANVTKNKGRAEFRGNPAQVPQSYIGSMNKDLVLFARE